MMDLDGALARYAAALEGLRPETVDALDAVMAPDIRFRDPFNDIAGLDHARALFRQMFEDCLDVRFALRGRFRDGERAVLLWTMDYRLRRWPDRPLKIEGASELCLDPASGLVTAHVDHWDAASQLYEHVPLLGFVLRRLRRRIATPAP
ncbi:nuclear transport factor 2 family protein [Zavarzinia aquatilis]|uniref:Nuclear transport factor 2 family protein n=1 Tax=Zavarzinia aquatilis TaxID=2211142 RepID=A0A317DVJ0_9PROT|nr:nuclear transport factor 2 family protein [Zavarzinia aquatilis]PWR18561.1 nuclear transport factor 2 family protein [Zavarzinia aquatilis]